MKKHVIHKNQIIITSLAILIAVAGYLSYDEHASRTSAGETGSGVRLERSTEIVSLYDGTEMDSTEMNPGESVFTGASVRTGDYAATAKMNREQARSKAKEELKAILDRTDLSKEEKQSAADALVVLTENAKNKTSFTYFQIGTFMLIFTCTVLMIDPIKPIINLTNTIVWHIKKLFIKNSA